MTDASSESRTEVRISLAARLGRSSVIYSATNVLQKGTLFLLLPLYTRFLTPFDYGVLALVTALNGVLTICFTLALQGAITRYYFEFRDQAETLRRFWGTIFTTTLAVSAIGAIALLALGDYLFAPLLGEVPFWPFAALGVIASFFQPLVSMFLGILQTREEAVKYAWFSLAQFLFTTILTIGLIVVAGMGAQGPLIALTLGAALFFGVALWFLRNEFEWCFDVALFRRAISYTLPQVPHALAGQISAVTDRFFLNGMRGASTAGVYSVGAMFGMIIDLICSNVNRAYVPISMDVLRRQARDEYPELANLGMAMAAVFCALGIGVAAFARELMLVFTAPTYHAAAEIIPVLAFAGVAGGFYYIYVNALFFDERGVRLIPICTAATMVANILLNLALIPHFGMMGAALANLGAQLSTAVIVAAIASRYDPVQWKYGRMAVAYFGSLAAGIGLGSLEMHGWPGFTVRLAGFLGAVSVLGWLLMGHPASPYRAVARLVASRV